MPGRERETVSRSRPGDDNPRGGWTMYENDFDPDNLTGDELLAEIGLDAYTIRKLRSEALPTEAGRGEEFSSV